MNNVAPNYEGLTFGNGVGIIDATTANALTWQGIEGSAGLFLVAGFTNFEITFPAPMATVSFLVGSPQGDQAVTINGVNYIFLTTPQIFTVAINSDSLVIEAGNTFTFDTATSTSSCTAPLPGAVILLGSGLLQLMAYGRKKNRRQM
ncbi:MAG: hypothetical protein PHF35_03800 [Candidatus Moranbacteria bacterium]|nr:hypothetical protein [Candidatus Moranbacteria bacterium]